MSWNIGICIDMIYPVDRWNESEGVIIIPWSAGPLASRLANGWIIPNSLLARVFHSITPIRWPVGHS